MTMKNIARFFFIGVLLILGSGFFSDDSAAQDAAPGDVIAGSLLLDGDPLAKKQYLLQISGTVMNETFSGDLQQDLRYIHERNILRGPGIDDTDGGSQSQPI